MKSKLACGQTVHMLPNVQKLLHIPGGSVQIRSGLYAQSYRSFYTIKPPQLLNPQLDPDRWINNAQVKKLRLEVTDLAK